MNLSSNFFHLLKRLRATHLAGLLFVGSLLPAQAGGLMVETDPATFALHGYAAHVHMPLADSGEASRWTVGVGTYSLTFPQAFRKLALNTNSSNTELKLRQAYGVFVDRYLSNDANQGPFIGVQLARQNYQIGNTHSAQPRQAYHAWVVMPRIGYRYLVGTTGWYVTPWMGVAHVSSTPSSVELSQGKVTTEQWLPYGALHVGYQF